jgi:hypothetical protein
MPAGTITLKGAFDLVGTGAATVNGCSISANSLESTTVGTIDSAAGGSIFGGLVTVLGGLTAVGAATLSTTLAVNGDSTLGNANADSTTVNGRLNMSSFDCSTNGDNDTLETLSTTPATYNGTMVYLGAYAATGTLAATYFSNPDKWYFCESGSWYPSPFNSGP